MGGFVGGVEMDNITEMKGGVRYISFSLCEVEDTELESWLDFKRIF